MRIACGCPAVSRSPNENDDLTEPVVKSKTLVFHAEPVAKS